MVKSNNLNQGTLSDWDESRQHNENIDVSSHDDIGYLGYPWRALGFYLSITYTPTFGFFLNAERSKATIKLDPI